MCLCGHTYAHTICPYLNAHVPLPWLRAQPERARVSRAPVEDDEEDDESGVYRLGVWCGVCVCAACMHRPISTPLQRLAGWMRVWGRED